MTANFKDTTSKAVLIEREISKISLGRQDIFNFTYSALIKENSNLSLIFVLLLYNIIKYDSNKK